MIYIFVIFAFLMLIVKKTTPNLYVQLSAGSISYYAYLPVIVKAWNLIGYKSIVILVFYNITKSIIYLRKVLKELGSDVIYFKLNNSFSLHYTSKLSRIFGFAISKKPRNIDYILSSDADMLPISKTFFSDLNYAKLTIKSFGPEGYGPGNSKGRWAMCYMVANNFIWKEILKRDIHTKDMEKIVSNIMKYVYQKGLKHFERFAYLDEVYLRDRIKEWKYFNTNVLFHERNFHKTRVNRNNFPINYNTIKQLHIIDIHLPQLPLIKEKIKNIWINTLIPLQLYLFNYTPFGENYINKIIKYSNN